MLHRPRPCPQSCPEGKAAPARLSVTGPFLWAACNAEFIGGGGLRTHIKTVPFCPSAQPQDGLSSPPALGPFLWKSKNRMKEAAN
jgi:hypothetical protein